MMKSSVFLVVFISTCFLVQGTVQLSGSQCQCDDSATVSKILLDISNLLDRLSENLVTNNTHPSTTTASPSTPPTSTTTEVFTTTIVANPSTEGTTAHPSTTSTELPSSSSTTITDPTTTTTEFTKPTTEHSSKIFICPENCYLDISGDYCNCYPPDSAEPANLLNTNL